MKKIYSLLLTICLLGVTACSESSLGEPITKIPDEPTNAIDAWILEQVTKPHNIEVIYKWVDSETDLGKNLVPPKEEVVIPFLDVLKKVWIDVYIDVAGLDYFNRLTPKQLLLVGSASYNQGGTITQGSAEGGRKIVLYEINDFDHANKPKLKRFFHVIHHEFAHITHQTRMYDLTTFGNITPEGYRSDWTNEQDLALDQGFISPYSRLTPDEDFVEIVATMLTTTRDEFEAIINQANAYGKAALEAKVAFVVSYFQKEWNIDMYKFQEKMAIAIDDVVNS